MNILITGANSMIGINILKKLSNHKIYSLIRSGSDMWRMQGINSNIVNNSLNDSKFWKDFLFKNKIDWIIHLAALGSDVNYQNYTNIYNCNLFESYEFFKICKSIENVKGFISTGSSAEYGIHEKTMAEIDLPKPKTAYGMSKFAFANTVLSNLNRTDFQFIHFRLYNMYGFFDNPTRLISRLTHHAYNGDLPKLSNPKNVRDYVFVHDFIELIEKIINSNHTYNSGIYNISSGYGYSLEQIVQIFLKIYNLDVPILWNNLTSREFDSKYLIGNPTKTENEFDWKTLTSIEKGIEKIKTWWKSSQLEYEYSIRMYKD